MRLMTDMRDLKLRVKVLPMMVTETENITVKTMMKTTEDDDKNTGEG